MKASTAIATALAVTAARAASVAETVGQLKTAGSHVQRLNILADDSDFVFDFVNSGVKETKGAGGRTVSANTDTFAAVVGNGMAMTLGFLGPCSMNTPHTHPRATEFNLVVNGTLHTGFLAENGARFIVNDVPSLSATIFPKGAIHFEANLGCEPVTFVAAFNDEDPGVLQIAQRFFGLPPDTVGQTLGGLGVEQVAELARLIPDNVALAVGECLTRCNMAAASAAQPIAQQQPRIAGNALPSPPAGGAKTFITGGAVQGGPPSSDSSSSHGSSSVPPGRIALAENTSNGSGDSTRSLLIAVLALNGLILAAVAAGAVFFVLRRRQSSRHSRSGSDMSTMPIAGPRPLLSSMGLKGSSRGKYAATEFEVPAEHDSNLSPKPLPARWDDPYDKPASRSTTPPTRGY